jgi:hypothetical protein
MMEVRVAQRLLEGMATERILLRAPAGFAPARR